MPISKLPPKPWVYQGKNLIPHPYVYHPFRLRVEGVNSIIGEVLIRGGWVPLSECPVVEKGLPHWFVHGVSLRLFEEDLEWRWLKKVREGWKIELKDLLNFETLFPYAPPIVGIPEGVMAILPKLKLSDPRGAFANLEETEWESDLLETDYIKKQVDNTAYYCPINRVAKSLTFLLECGWEVEDYLGRPVRKVEGQVVEMGVEGDSILVKGHLNYDTHKANITDVVGAFNRKEHFIELGDGVGLLPEGGPFEGLIEGEVVGEAICLKRFQMASYPELLEIEGVSYDRALERLKGGYQEVEATLAPYFSATLRPYQQEGLKWLSFLAYYGFSGILADDMGLGKTVQVLAYLSTQKGRTLIIVPTSLLFNWKQEIMRFLPESRVTLYSGKDLPETGIILTSYGRVRGDGALQEAYFDSLILDEAQSIKNPDSQIAHAVCKIKAPFRLSVTGTPVENRLEELWSHFRFLMPDLLGDRVSFLAKARVANVDGRYLKEIQRKVAPFILRRKKEEVAKDLPEKVELIEWVEMEEKQRTVYDNQLRAAKTAGQKMEVLKALLRLRQICCHPALVGEEGGSAKLDRLLADLEQLTEEGKKILVYSQFTSMLNLIQRQWGKPTLRLDGATQNREKVVAQFQEDKKENIFLISLKAGGVGLNLTAADYVLLYDPWWNVAAEAQAIDRAHRIGREGGVIAKRYVIAESVEEKMMKLKERKLSLGEGLLEGVGKGLSRQDLEGLLES